MAGTIERRGSMVNDGGKYEALDLDKADFCHSQQIAIFKLDCTFAKRVVSGSV